MAQAKKQAPKKATVTPARKILQPQQGVSIKEKDKMAEDMLSMLKTLLPEDQNDCLKQVLNGLGIQFHARCNYSRDEAARHMVNLEDFYSICRGGKSETADPKKAY